MRFFRHAAVVLALALTIGGPVSAAPVGTATTQTTAATSATTTTLAGNVYDNATNSPIGGATVTASSGGQDYTATTGPDGSFTLSLPPGVYDLTVVKGGFQTAQVQEYVVAPGVTSTIKIGVSEAQSTTLRTIGRINVARKNGLNTSVTATSSLDNAYINQQDQPNLTEIVGQLPGVTVSRTSGATANTFYEVRGAELEGKVNIDGHPLSVGTFGTWNTNYAIGEIFENVEVLKGPGLNGPTAGESAFGTINLRTRDFSPKNYVDVKGGLDSLKGSFFNVFGNVNLFGGKVSLLAGKAESGYRGPWDEYMANRVGFAGSFPVDTYTAPTFPGLIQWQGDLSNRYNLSGELAKMRVRFSQATSLTATFLGLEGQYVPQGGSYASFEGNEIVQACVNGSSPQPTMATCTANSQYNAPYSSNLIGSVVPAYFWFPSSYIQNNEPMFSAELRTTLRNDTFLLRPYVAEINRFISGDRENRYPGNNGGWFEVTNSANCQSVFRTPGSTPGIPGGGAAGPCFANNMSGPTGPAYIGASDPAGVVYSTTSAVPNCTAATPCWTTSTAFQNDGKIGFGTPFSQPEVDHLHGMTFQYLHPVHDNLYGFSYEYNADDTYSTTTDTTSVLPGCTPVVGSGVTNNPAAIAAGFGQATCTRGNFSYQGTAVTPTPFYGTLPTTDIAIPPTIVRKNDFAATAQLQLTPAWTTSLGLYYTNYRSASQTEDPALLAHYRTLGNAQAAPVSLISVGNSVHHVDPHIGFTYRANHDVVLRASGGSSVTLPYASLISGLGRVDLPNGANGQQYTLTLANTQLAPESTVAYDLGMDLRTPDASLFSLDFFDNTIHNVWAALSVPIDPVPGVTCGPPCGGFFQSETINGPISRYYGSEISMSRSPALGWGYTVTGTFERAYFDQFSNAIYISGQNTIVNGKQFDGSANFNSVPYAKGYGEIRWSGVRNSQFSIGMDYEGANNATYGPAYTIWNGTGRFEVSPGWTFQAACQNLFNLNTGSLLGRALFNQGAGTLTLGPAVGTPAGTVPVNLSSGTRAKSLQMVIPKTWRFSLSHHFGN